MNKTLGTTLLVSGTMIGAGMLAMPLTSAGIGFAATAVLGDAELQCFIVRGSVSNRAGRCRHRHLKRQVFRPLRQNRIYRSHADFSLCFIGGLYDRRR